MVLLHELAHVKRRDALFHLLASLAKALHWVNPLVWVAVRQMRSAAERATDDRVLAGGTENSSYARLLVEFAGRQLGTPSPVTPAVASSMAKPDTVEARVRRILDPAQRRARPGRIAAAGLAGGFACLLAAVGGIALAEGEKDAGSSEADKAAAKSVAKLRHKLGEIVIDQVSFSEATLSEAVDFCVRKSVEADPDGHGLNIIVIKPPREHVEEGIAEPRLNLLLRKIPLGELLRYMGMQSGMKLDVEPHSIVFRPRWDESGRLKTKTFTLSPDLIERVLATVAGGGAFDPDPFGDEGVEDVEEPDPAARDWLRYAGVEFPDGSSALYEPLSKKLIVRNTQTNLMLVDEIVKSLQGVEPPEPPRPEALQARLRSIVIPRLDFTEATLDEAVEFLRSKSGDGGVNLVVNHPAQPAEKGVAVPIAATASLQLTDIPLEAALNYITEALSYSYRVEPHAVVLSPFHHYDEGALDLRTFPIKSRPLQARFEARMDAAREWLESLGVRFPDGSSGYYEPVGRNLIIRSTPQQIVLVEDALASIPDDAEMPEEGGGASGVSATPANGLTDEDRKRARNVVVLFHASKTIDERLAHVREPERVRPLMDAWYGKNKPMVDLDGIQNISIKVPHSKMIEDQGRNFVILAMSVHDSGMRMYAIEKTGEGMKLDWETAVGYQPMPIDEFKEKRPTEPLPFRVKMKATGYENAFDLEKNRLLEVELSYPGRPEFKLYAVIDRKEEWAQPLFSAFDQGLAPSVIANLKYADPEGNDPLQVEIDSIVADTWWPKPG